MDLNTSIIIFGVLGDLGVERGDGRDAELFVGVITLLNIAMPGDIIPEGILEREPRCDPSLGSSSSEEIRSETGFKVEAIQASQAKRARAKILKSYHTIIVNTNLGFWQSAGWRTRGLFHGHVLRSGTSARRKCPDSFFKKNIDPKIL